MGSHRLNIVLDEPSVKKLDQIQKELFGLNKSAIIRMLLAKYEELQQNQAQAPSPWTPAPAQRQHAPQYQQPAPTAPQVAAPPVSSTVAAPVVEVELSPVTPVVEVEVTPPAVAVEVQSTETQEPVEVAEESKPATEEGRRFRVQTHRSDFW